MKYQSFLPEAQAKIKTGMFNVIEAVAKNTERIVKKTFRDFPNPPIETGNLRRNVVGSVLKQTDLEVFGEVRASTPLVKGKDGKKRGNKEIEYAKYIEYGTHKMPPRPFMRVGVAKALKSNEAIIKKLAK